MEWSEHSIRLTPVSLLQRVRAVLRGAFTGRSRRVATIGFGVAVGLALGVAVVLLATRDDGLPDLRGIEQVDARKAAFFGYLRPIVEAKNRAIADDRERLLTIAQKFAEQGRISVLDELWLRRLARDYRLEWTSDAPGELIAELKRRVDIVPIPLVLVQAAKESGWGTSRFAREANNLFGQWCYREGCGVVPKRRVAGANHEVRSFASVGRAIDAYLRNINSGNAYARLRQIRAGLRAQGKRLTGAALADGLLFYSQRRQAYVEEVKSMLRQYHDFVDEQSA